MKRILSLIIGLFALATITHAQVSGSFTNGVNLLSTTGVRLFQLHIFNTSGAANTFVLYDNDSATSTNRARPAYDLVTQYSTNVVMTFTNFAGVVQTSTNTVLARVTTTVAAATNEARRVYQVVVPASGDVLIAPSSPLGTTYGLSVWATSNALYNASFNTIP